MTPNDFVLTLRKYFTRLSRHYAFRIDVEADDLFQDFVVHALGHFAEVQEHKNLLPVQYARNWVRRVVQGHCRRRIKPLPLLIDVIDTRGDQGDPTAAVELADELTRLGMGMGLLSPRRRAAVALRFGLDGSPLCIGPVLAECMGVTNRTSDELVRNGLEDLARVMRADPARARVSRSEGIKSGHARKKREKMEQRDAGDPVPITTHHFAG